MMGNEGSITDEQLMQQIKQGQKASLKMLYQRHAAALTAFVGQMMNDPYEAADVTHEAFISLWDGSANFREDKSLRAWLYAIARNKAIDRLRKSNREVLGDPDPNVPDLDPDPERVAQICEDRSRVRICLDKLSATHRNVVSLSFFEGMNYREIAEIENVSEGTIKSRVFHAKKLLMHCLSQ
ncbi:MAG: RNA polymerase sigma factor [Pseudomonadota bacterium]